MNDDWPIYPGVKRAAAVLARVAQVGMLAWSLCAVLEIACSALAEAVQSRGVLIAAVLCGYGAVLFPLVAVTCLGPLAAWCHLVLPSGRGSVFTRFLTQLAAFLSLLIPVCAVYALVMHEPLLARQAEIPLYITAIVFFAALVNLPNIKAAAVFLRVQVVLFPLFLLASMAVEPIPLQAAFALLATAAGFHPLRLLSATAERIVSLPDKEDI
ncbi:MAG: hypothetical protein MJ056_03355 [Akkermansia sp.]|nr:hypothetical protein [Akkermansia sp.]